MEADFCLECRCVARIILAGMSLQEWWVFLGVTSKRRNESRRAGAGGCRHFVRFGLLIVVETRGRRVMANSKSGRATSFAAIKHNLDFGKRETGAGNGLLGRRRAGHCRLGKQRDSEES